MEQYATGLQQLGLGFRWPFEGTEDRVSYYSMMVEVVARTLRAAGRVPAVGDQVSALAFNRNGILVDKMLRRGGDFCRDPGAMASFCPIYNRLR